MPLLQVRDMPEDLYKKLAEMAEEDNRSIAQETIALLKKALGYTESRQARRKHILNKIYNDPIPNIDTLPDPATLIREDRER